MREWEYLCGVRERNRTFTRRVARVKEVDEKGNRSQLDSFTSDPETESCTQESPAHVREGEKQQCSSAIGIDRPHSRPGKNEIN